MALKTLVKVGSITHLSDARYCAGMGVDFLGFQAVAGETAAIPVQTFQEIRGWITGPQIVAEIYGIGTRGELDKVVEEFRPDYFELSLAEYARVGQFLSLPYILRIDDQDDIQHLAERPAILLIGDVSTPISKVAGEYDILVRVRGREELDRALFTTGISGVSLTGTSEIRPGLKPFDELADILEALEQD